MTDNAVKVVCFPMPLNSFGYQDRRPEWRRVQARMSLPFVYGRGTYCHRVRSVTIWIGQGRMSVSTWCGQAKHPTRGARLTGEVPDGYLLCGTCHGRAVGAGQVDQEGRPLIFTPRVDYDLGQCCWEHPGRGPYSSPGRCFRRAVERLPEAPDVKVGVCAEHARKWPPTVRWRYEASLANAGLALVPAVAVRSPGLVFDPGPDDDLSDLFGDTDD